MSPYKPISEYPIEPASREDAPGNTGLVSSLFLFWVLIALLIVALPDLTDVALKVLHPELFVGCL